MTRKRFFFLGISIVVLLSIIEMTYDWLVPPSLTEEHAGLDRSFTGFGAFVELFRASGVEVSVNYSPYRELADEGAPLWVISPWNVQRTDGEALAEWVSRGNMLVLVPASGGSDGALREFFDALDVDEPDRPARLHAVSGTSDGGLDVCSSIEEPDLRLFVDRKTMPASWRPIASVGGTTILYEREHGEGRIALYCAGASLENLVLMQGDNAALAHDVAAHYQGDRPRVIFDRYAAIDHQQGNAFTLMLTPPFSRVTLAISLLGLVVVWAQWFSRAPSREPDPARRRERSEYVEALARLISSPANRGPTLALYRQHLQSSLTARYQHAAHSREALAEVLHSRFGLSEVEVAELLDESTPSRISEAELLRRLARLDTLMERMQHVHER